MSNTQQQLKTWLNELEQTDGLALSLDEQGSCYLEFRSGHVQIIHAPEQGDFIYFSVLLKASILDLTEEDYREYLKLNFQQDKTSGATIAFDEQANALVLNYRKSSQEMNAKTLLEVIYRMFNTVLELETPPEAEEDNEEESGDKLRDFSLSGSFV